MLFHISWKMYDDKKMDCYQVFSKMTPEDDVKDAGENIRIVGRWHHVGGGSGVCICETDSSRDLTQWMLNWAGMCDLTVLPVVDDQTCREVVRNANK